MRERIIEGYDPWAGAFDELRALDSAKKDCMIINKDKSVKYFYNTSKAHRYDADTAYVQTIMWWVTGDKDYLNNALTILRSYNDSMDPSLFASLEGGGYGWSADIIGTGCAINKFCFAAEILRAASEYSGWTQTDTDKFINILKMSYPLYDRRDKWMNQTGFTFMALTSSAVFQNDADMYQDAIERASVNKFAGWPNADASISCLMRLVTKDGGGKPLGREQIQLAEMGRDQPHAVLNIGILSSIAQTAYIQGTQIDENGDIVKQGVNLFEFLDNRLLKGINYCAKYNLGYDVDWYPIRSDTASKDETESKFTYYTRVSTNKQWYW